MYQTEKDRILRRIKKCLALSKSDNEHEAAAALRQARRMMNMHGIDITEASSPNYEVYDLSDGMTHKSRLTQAEKVLYGVVSRFFGCTLYYCGGWPVIIGVSPAPKIVEYASSVLLRQMFSGYKDVLRAIEDKAGGEISAPVKRKAIHYYSLAWVASVESKVRDFAVNTTQQQKRCHEKALDAHWGV